jgi:pyruvate formate lyase activating enzyme
MRCKWCSNPESQHAEPCFMGEGNKNAPDSQYYSVEETLKICLQDRHFYEDSAGGVTLSGGEPLTQPDFVIAMLQSLHEKGIHAALETSGYAPQEIFSNVSILSDLILFDIKDYDERRHVEGAGVDNGIILANLKNALDKKIQIMARLPVIPGYNDSQEDAHAFAILLNSLGLKSVQLLPFHQLGERKYDLLNISYQMRGIPQLHEVDLAEFKEIINAAGITCFI